MVSPSRAQLDAELWHFDGLGVGGYPALVNPALYHLRLGEITLSPLLETAATTTGIYSHYLQRHRVTLDKQPELASSLNDVMSTTESVELESIIEYKLCSLGLIKQLGNKAIAGCELYRQYFKFFCDNAHFTVSQQLIEEGRKLNYD